MDESEKTLKIGFRPRPMSRKQQKERFGHSRKTKNGENCISATAEIEKTLKITFPTPWKQKKCLKTAFSPYEKHKNTLKSALPPYGKCKKSLKTAFPPYGKRKNSRKTAFSPYGKCKNSPKMAFSPYGKHKNSLKMAFSPYGKAERLMLKQTSRVYSFLNAASNAWFSVFVPIVMRRQFSQCSMCAQLCTAIP